MNAPFILGATCLGIALSLLSCQRKDNAIHLSSVISSYMPSDDSLAVYEEIDKLLLQRGYTPMTNGVFRDHLDMTDLLLDTLSTNRPETQGVLLHSATHIKDHIALVSYVRQKDDLSEARIVISLVSKGAPKQHEMARVRWAIEEYLRSKGLHH